MTIDRGILLSYPLDSVGVRTRRTEQTVILGTYHIRGKESRNCRPSR